MMVKGPDNYIWSFKLDSVKQDVEFECCEVL